MASPKSDSYSADSGQGVYGGRSAFPLWRAGQAVNEWRSIASSTLAGSPAAPSDLLDSSSISNRRLSYSNIAKDGRNNKIFIIAGGGHSDYSGNEVTSLDLDDDAPSWIQVRAKTSVVTNDQPYNISDGTPTSRHLYHNVVWNQDRLRFILHATRGMYPTGGSSNKTNGFDPSTNNWDAAGTYADSEPNVQCTDALGNAWGGNNYTELWKWDNSTGIWSQSSNSALLVGTPVCFDTNRNLLFGLFFGDGRASGSGLTAWKSNNGATAVAITFNASAGYTAFLANESSSSYAAMVFNPINDCFYWWEGTSRVLYKIIPNSGTVWDISVVSITGSLPPVRSATHGRMAYHPSLGGISIMQSGFQPMNFLRTE